MGLAQARPNKTDNVTVEVFAKRTGIFAQGHASVCGPALHGRGVRQPQQKRLVAIVVTSSLLHGFI